MVLSQLVIAECAGQLHACFFEHLYKIGQGECGYTLSILTLMSFGVCKADVLKDMISFLPAANIEGVVPALNFFFWDQITKDIVAVQVSITRMPFFLRAAANDLAASKWSRSCSK